MLSPNLDFYIVTEKKQLLFTYTVVLCPFSELYSYMNTKYRLANALFVFRHLGLQHLSFHFQRYMFNPKYNYKDFMTINEIRKLNSFLSKPEVL